MKGLLLTFLTFFISTSTPALQAPWQTEPESSSPWGSDDRRERREGFFDSLGQGRPSPKAIESEIHNAKPSEPNAEDSSDDTESNKDLNLLPWSSHRATYPSEKFSSKLVWPVDSGRLTSGYGIRNGKFHEGIDISAGRGSWIRTTAPGKVVFNGRISGYGKVVVVYHGDGVSSVYAHNSVNLKRRGTTVKRGDVIAKVGRTGHAIGTHCHFEIRKDGKPVNPLQFTYLKNPVLAKR